MSIIFIAECIYGVLGYADTCFADGFEVVGGVMWCAERFRCSGVFGLDGYACCALDGAADGLVPCQSPAP